MLKKILNKKKEETDSSSDSEDDTVPHVGKKEKKSSVASLKEKLGGGPTKKESKSSVRLNFVLSGSFKIACLRSCMVGRNSLSKCIVAIKLANPLDHTSVQLCFAFHRQAVVISGLTKDSQQSKDVEERNISTGPCRSCVSGQSFV